MNTRWEEAPVAQFVARILDRAIRDGASDVHLEPSEASLRIRFRVDGELSNVQDAPRELAGAALTRVKVAAGLDIAERRLPQDGRIRWRVDGREVDLRVSTLPTGGGESIAIRILDPARARLDVSQLGLPPGIELGLRRALAREDGLLVVTGPTGAGKTTTLYSALRMLNRPGSKILTVEDPVEYEIDGVVQVSTNPRARMTFAGALRSFLRQDPDVIMVGEVRDPETAQVAVQAALTGHLVLTTLHTEDSAGAIIRLVDLGVPPYLVAATLGGVLAQRLVRAESGARRGVFEWLEIDSRVRELICRGAPQHEIRASSVTG